jgi:hypothetical protein
MLPRTPGLLSLAYSYLYSKAFPLYSLESIKGCKNLLRLTIQASIAY